MTIQDIAGNPLLTQSTAMIGFTPIPDIEAALSLKIYPFLIEIIREQDQSIGSRFVERFLEGPQNVWDIIHNKIIGIPILWNVAEIPDEFLKFLKRIVGWTVDLDSITSPLDFLTLRRLISASVAFWKKRGPEDSIEDILSLVTGARLRIWNWFDFRIVLDESAFGEDWNGFDPWMISLPGPPNEDQQRFNVRIVDDGTLNKTVVKDLVKLTRPSGERVEISYIRFLDLFQVDDDNSQWANETDPFSTGDSASKSAVDSGTMIVTPTVAGERAAAFVSLSAAVDWTNYVTTWRIKGLDTRCIFYRTSNGDLYYTELEVSTNNMRLRKIVAGVDTSLGADVDMLVTLGLELESNVFYAIRVAAVTEGGSTRITVFFESNLVFSVLDASHAAGAIGFGHDTSGTVELDEAELFFNPLFVEVIDINP